MKALDLVRIHKIQYEFWVIKYVKDLLRFFFICWLFFLQKFHEGRLIIQGMRMYFVFLLYLYGSLALAKEYPENQTVYLLFSSKKIFPPYIILIFCCFPFFEMALKILLCFWRSSIFLYSTSFYISFDFYYLI